MNLGYVAIKNLKNGKQVCIYKECCCDNFSEAIQNKAIEDSNDRFYISSVVYFNYYCGRHTRMEINSCPFCGKRLNK